MLQPRPISYLWIVAAFIFLLAVFHTLGGSSTAELPSWVTDKVPSLGGSTIEYHVTEGDGGRMSLADHMKLSEKSWKKTVRQRHKLVHDDWKGSDDIPL